MLDSVLWITVCRRVVAGPMVAAADGGGGARYAAALCVMYWLLLTYPITLVIASVATILVTALIYLKVKALLHHRLLPSHLSLIHI